MLSGRQTVWTASQTTKVGMAAKSEKLGRDSRATKERQDCLKK
jgi:hypothetical protein